MIIRVRNWEKFQHYHHRAPPWIKLHRTVLDDDVFQALSGDDAKLLINLWLLASECEGAIKTSPRALAWRLRVASTRSVSNGITRLSSAAFITLSDDAGNVLAECLQDASEMLDQSRVEESRDRVETEGEEQRLSTSLVQIGTIPLGISAKQAANRARTEQRRTVEAALDLAAATVFAYWRDRMGKDPSRTILNEKRRSRIVARLRENGGDVSELLYCVDGALRDDWTMGRDPRSPKPYNGTETIFRDREKVETLIALTFPHEGPHPYLEEPNVQA